MRSLEDHAVAALADRRVLVQNYGPTKGSARLGLALYRGPWNRIEDERSIKAQILCNWRSARSSI